jgi:hypothetical protein
MAAQIIVWGRATFEPAEAAKKASLSPSMRAMSVEPSATASRQIGSISCNGLLTLSG